MPKVEINDERCKSCELCVISCTRKCLEIGRDMNSSGYFAVRMVKPEDCKGCNLCAEMCPDMVLTVYK